MNPFLTSSLLTALLQSSLLVAGAWLLILLTQRKASAARRSTASRFTMAAALVLVAVTLGQTALSLTPDRNSVSAPAPLPQGTGFIAENVLLHFSEIPSGQKPPSSPAVSPIPNPTSTGPLLLSAGHLRWLGAAWLTGAALVLTAWLRSLVARLTLLHRSENAVGASWLQTAGEVKGWPLVQQVRLIPHEITPCVWGARKSVLALPASAPAWPAAKLKLVLAHECAHLLRRDPLWQILSRFFLALLWFHPLAWDLARRSQAADEQAADDTVLRTECDAPSYAGLLVECARQFSLPPALQATASAMAGPSTLTRRVEAVLNPAADRRPVSVAGLMAWAAALTLLTAISSYAAPEISTAPGQEIQDPKPEPDPKLAQTDEPPLFSPPAATPQPGLKLTADTIVLPGDKITARKTYRLKGSVKASMHDFTISADEMTVEMESGQAPPKPTETIDPMNLKSVAASGSVVVEGKIDGVELSAKADSVVYTKTPPEQGIVLSGWPVLKTGFNLIEGLKQDSKIIIGSNGTNRCENCRISTLPPARKQSSATTPAPPETPIPSPEGKPSSSPFSWNPVSLNGLDYLPFWQLKEFYRFPTLSTTEPGKNFELRSNTMIVKGTMGTNEILVNNVRFLLKHPILDSAGMPLISRQDLSRILDPVIRPSASDRFNELAMVVIDPGHGGNDTGASGAPDSEAAYPLDAAQRLQRQLEERGIKAILTGNDGRPMTLKERSDFAASHPKAILIRLYFRSGPPEGQGIQTFFPDEDSARADRPENPGGSDYFTACVRLATAVHANCLYKLRGTDGGIRAAESGTISSQFKTPAILIECGYPGHPDESARIATEAYRQALAEAVAGGVQNFFRAIRKESTVPKRQSP